MLLDIHRRVVSCHVVFIIAAFYCTCVFTKDVPGEFLPADQSENFLSTLYRRDVITKESNLCCFYRMIIFAGAFGLHMFCVHHTIKFFCPVVAFTAKSCCAVAKWQTRDGQTFICQIFLRQWLTAVFRPSSTHL